MVKDRLIVKTEWDHDAFHNLMCDATLNRHRLSPKVREFLKNPKRNIITRLEFRNDGGSLINVIVELFERLESDKPVDSDGD